MFEQCIYFNLSTLTRKISKIWQTEFGRLGLSPSHGYLLFAIVEEPEASQKDLSQLMELDASTITRFIDSLVAKGLVEKTSKGKGSVFAVTHDGKKTYRSVKKTMDGLYQSMQSYFGAKKFEHLVGNLYQARQSLADS